MRRDPTAKHRRHAAARRHRDHDLGVAGTGHRRCRPDPAACHPVPAADRRHDRDHDRAADQEERSRRLRGLRQGRAPTGSAAHVVRVSRRSPADDIQFVPDHFCRGECKPASGELELAAAKLSHSRDQRAGCVAYLLLHAFVLGRDRRGWSRKAADSRHSGRSATRWPAAIIPCRVSQSVRMRRERLRRRGVAMDHDREQRGRRDGADRASRRARAAWRAAGSLPPVEVGSGLPPSAQTRRSIISLSEDGAWYQLTGQTIMMPCAAAHIG